MATHTLTGAGYWGQSGLGITWANVAYGDLVDINGVPGTILTVDPSNTAPVGFAVGVSIRIRAMNKLVVINNSSTTALLHIGPGLVSAKLTIDVAGEIDVQGGYLNIGTGDGSQNQILTNWTSFGWNVKDEPSVIFTETYSGSGVYIKRYNIGPYALSGYAGTGELGNFFSFDPTNGNITFGDDGKPQSLTSNANSGQAQIAITDATNYAVNAFIHVIDSQNRQSLPCKIISKSGNTLTIDRNLDYSFTTANSAFVRLSTGANTVPSGANIRTYNTGFGSIVSAGGARAHSTNFASGTVGDYQWYCTGNMKVRNLHCFGFYNYFRFASVLDVDHLGGYSVMYFHTNYNQTIKNLTKTISRYDTTSLTGIYLIGSTDSMTFEDCSAIANNSFAVRASLATNCTFKRTTAILLLRSSTAHRAFMAENIPGFTCEDLFAVGPVAPCGNFLRTRHCDGMSTEVTTNATESFNNGTYLYCSLYNISSISDGFNVYGNVPLFRGQFNFIVKVRYAWYKSAQALFNITAISPKTVLSDFITDYNTTIGVNNLLTQKIYTTKAGVDFALSSSNTIKRQGEGLSQSGVGKYYTSAFGSTFYDFRFFSNKTSGCMGVWFTEVKSDSSNYVIFSDQTKVRMFGGGALYILGDNEYAIFRTPYRIKGIDFPATGTIQTGLETGFTYEFKIATGTEFNSTWLPLHHTNLNSFNSSIDKETGFLFDLKISRTTASSTVYCSLLNWTTNCYYDEYPYPDYEVTVTLSSNVSLSGAEVHIYKNTSGDLIGTEFSGVESNPAAGYSFVQEEGTGVSIQIMQVGYKEYVLQYTVPASDVTIPVQLIEETDA